MFWLYVILALVAVSAGVAGVETYNHALTGKAQAEGRAANAEARAGAEHLARQNLQELVDYGDQVAKDRGKENDALRQRLSDAERKHAAAAKGDPCVGAAVPAATRQLRRDAFGDNGASAGVLHPAPGAPADAGPAPAGRSVGGPAQGSGPGPGSPPPVQRGQVDGAPGAGEAKPTTQSLRARLEALMRR